MFLKFIFLILVFLIYLLCSRFFGLLESEVLQLMGFEEI